MVTNNKDSIRFAPSGQIYIASLAKNPTMPLTPTTPLGADWLPLGYVSADGVEMTPEVSTQGLESWQSATPILYTVTAAALSIKATLLQVDPATTSLYFGADWEAVTDSQGATVAGSYRLRIESNPSLAECAMVIEWGDARVNNRLVIPRGMVSARDALKLTRSDAQSLGVTYEALDSAGELGYILTDDPAMKPSTAITVPTLMVTPGSIVKGNTVTISGSNWGTTAPTVTVDGASASKFTASAVAVTGGVLSGSLAVAADAPGGEYVVRATGAAGTKTTALTVTTS